MPPEECGFPGRKKKDKTGGVPFSADVFQGSGTLPDDSGRSIMRVADHFRLPLLFLAAAGILMFFPETASFLELRMESPAEWSLLYRCFTAHFVHFTLQHFVSDALVFLILGWLVCREEERAFLPLILFSSFVISLCVWIFCRELYSCRGLSGIDCALFGWLAVRYLPRRRKIVLPLLAAFCLKTVWECATGEALFAGTDVFEAVPAAHLAGCFCGILLGGKLRIRWTGCGQKGGIFFPGYSREPIFLSEKKAFPRQFFVIVKRGICAILSTQSVNEP